METDTWWQRFN